MQWCSTVAGELDGHAMLTLVRRREPDAGFTLVELVITVAIISIIATALIGVVFSYLRVTNETSTRLNESTDQQFVSAYWQQDVSSLGVHGVPSGGVVPTSQSVWVGSAPGSLPGACAGQANAVIAFAWNDYKGVPTGDAALAWTGASLNAVVYYTATATNANGTSQTQLWRRRCGDVSGNVIVARYLTGAPTVACQNKAGGSVVCSGVSPLPATVTMTMNVQDLGETVHASTGYTNLVLTGHRRQG